MENQALLENIKDQWSFKTHGESRTNVFDQTLKERDNSLNKAFLGSKASR